MDMNTTGKHGAGQDGAKNLPYDRLGQNGMRNLPFDQVGQDSERNLRYYREGQNSVRNPQYEPSEHRNMVGNEDPRNTYPLPYDARNNIPPEAFAHRRVRGTTPDVDMRPACDTTYLLFRDMASLVSQLASEVQFLKSNPMPPATAADNHSLSIFTPDAVGRPPAVVAVPLPTPLVVSTGKPVHYESGTRPKRQHTV